MRIGIDIRCLMNNQYSGVSWYTYHLLRNLFELDHDNQYILFYNSNKPVELPPFTYANVRYFGCRYPNKLFNLALNFFNYPQIDKLIGGVDLFFVPNLHFIAWSNRCKKIITVHDLSFLHFPEFFTAKMHLWHKLIIKKGLLNQADLVMVDSLSTKNDLIELLHLPAEKIRVVYLGVEQKYFLPIDVEQLASVRKKYHLPDKFILSLGTLEPRKNLEGIIAAYRSLAPQVDLVIAGPAGWKSRLEKKASFDQHIRFIGYVAEEDKPALYQMAEVLAYPSFYEGFGLPLLEAMASGCPVIAGSNSSQVEVASQAGILVDPNNLTEIKLALASVLEDQEWRSQLIEKGRRQATKFFWVKTAQTVKEIFDSFKTSL